MQKIRGASFSYYFWNHEIFDSMTHLIVLLIDGNPYGYGKWLGLWAKQNAVPQFLPPKRSNVNNKAKSQTIDWSTPVKAEAHQQSPHYVTNTKRWQDNHSQKNHHHSHISHHPSGTFPGVARGVSSTWRSHVHPPWQLDWVLQSFLSITWARILWFK